MNKATPSIHEAYNARSLTIDDLCKSFIVNDHYYNLASSCNSIMIGPRGSGKTTLMRMLQVAALEIWEHSEASYFRNQVKFTGVFIPTDRLWKSQFDNLESTFSHDTKLLEILHSSFLYHVLERLSSCVEFRASKSDHKPNQFRSVTLSKIEEQELVSELCNLWKVSPRTGSLRSLELAVIQKKQEISDYVSTKLGRQDYDQLEAPAVLKSPISPILGNSVRIINKFFKEDEGKWSFLFDELELAPDSIIQPLVDSMRGGPDDIFFKLSLSPYHKGVSVTQNSSSTMKGHDSSYINLTNFKNNEGLAFAKKLCSKVFQKKGIEAKEIDRYFESSKKFDYYKEIRCLAKKDSTFSSYLSKQGISLENLEGYKESDKLTLIRKIKFIAAIRNYQMRDDGSRLGRRSPLQTYSGFKYICKAMEFNPRMLIGIMNSLLKHASEDGEVSISDQQKCLQENLQSYSALLQTIPIDTETGSRKLNTILDLVEVVAEFFRSELLAENFKSEPKGTLVFKSEKSLQFLEPIGLALNAGALIAETTDSTKVDNVLDIKSSRIRLSRVFAHKYNLLVNEKPRSIDLFDILKNEEKQNNAPVVHDLFNNLD